MTRRARLAAELRRALDPSRVRGIDCGDGEDLLQQRPFRCQCCRLWWRVLVDADECVDARFELSICAWHQDAFGDINLPPLYAFLGRRR